MAYADLNGIHTPTPGNSPPASWGAQVRDNFEFLNTGRREIVTSSTRPASPFEGLEIYETDTNRVYVHDGTDWRRFVSIAADETYTPTWTQSATISKTTTLAAYRRTGRRYEGNIVLAATSAGTATNGMLVTTPATASSAGTAPGVPVGQGWYSNGSVNLPLIVVLSSTSAFGFLPAFTASTALFGVTAVLYTSGAAANTSFTPTVANGHTLSFDFSFTATA